ncbi:centrosomal protein 20 isoform X3 [Hyla sarda]|uniref:centrosomal protein 20 isoform X3 n=1 Tax=Hyla sarda TaxID=327740 RepID=UPI0024C2FFE5|nr:centrosomal protein 20 isoform X3 [Hyla sarda]
MIPKVSPKRENSSQSMYCTVLPADQSFHRLPVSSTKMAASLPAGHSYFHNSCRSSVCLIEAEARLRSGVAVGVTSRTIYSPVNVMATVSDLKAVLADTLDKRGVLGQLKARVRAEVFAALDDQSEPKPVLSHENLLINEMIREYLEFNKYKYTSSVLTAGDKNYHDTLKTTLDKAALLKIRTSQHRQQQLWHTKDFLRQCSRRAERLWRNWFIGYSTGPLFSVKRAKPK